MDVLAVRIPPSTRSTTCNADGIELQVGDGCILETDRGQEFGIVTRPALDNPYYEAQRVVLPRVVRRARREDEEAFAHKVSVEKEARDYCRERIAERDLEMRLGHVDMQLDGKKLVFFFTADSRVDFRGLVRDLAGRFRTRIELRQIGSRDDAQMQGGCGPCGRSLCCSTWMRGFDPVSIKMAKAQGLSLNPSKISGLCGRLMCCLKYEYDDSGNRKKAGCPKKSRSAAEGNAGNG